MTAEPTLEGPVPMVPQPIAGLGRALRRRRRWVTCIAAISLAIGAVYAMRSRPLYSASARIRLLNDRSIGMFSDNRAPSEDAATLRSQYYVLRSPRILAVAAQRLDLEQRWQTNAQAAISRLQGEVNPKRMLDANVTEVRVTDPDPQLAAEIANAVVDVYATQANQPRMEQAQVLLERLQNKTHEQAELLRQAEEQVQSVRQTMGLPAGENRVSDSSLYPLRQQLAQAEADLIDAQMRHESIVQAKTDLVLALQAAPSGDAVARDLAAKLVQTESRLAQLDGMYGKDNPAVRQCQIDLERLSVTARDQVDRIAERAKLQRSAADARAQYARRRLEEAQQSMAAVSGAYSDLLRAQDHEDVQRNLHKMLNDRTQKLAVDLQSGGPAAELIEPAVAATSPDMGSPRQILLLSLGIGLVAGAMLAGFVDWMDGTIREPDEVATQLNLQLLGIVGRVRTLLSPAERGRDVEGYRMIRNGIDFADHTLRSLCVTEAVSGEGAAVTAANLAWAWAEHGARVLVIDANLANPKMHSLFGLSNDSGLVDFLAAHRRIDELMVATSVAGVALLPAGGGSKPLKSPPPITPHQLGEMLIWARSHADLIILQAGPVLKQSDAAIIARQADATVLAIRQGRCEATELRRAAHLLGTTGEGLLGAVLTDVPSGATWDPLPLNSAASVPGESAIRRSIVSKMRKRTREAA